MVRSEWKRTEEKSIIQNTFRISRVAGNGTKGRRETLKASTNFFPRYRASGSIDCRPYSEKIGGFMEITFACPTCKQQLETDSALSGTTINCPACNATLVIPEPDPALVRTAPTQTHDPEKHFVVPVHSGPTESLIKKPNPPLDAAPKGDGTKHLRVKSIRRTECIEVGKDHFDEVVSEFLKQIGDQNLVSISSINYSTVDIGSQKILTDYGVMIVYRG